MERCDIYLKSYNENDNLQLRLKATFVKVKNKTNNSASSDTRRVLKGQFESLFVPNILSFLVVYSTYMYNAKQTKQTNILPLYAVYLYPLDPLL